MNYICYSFNVSPVQPGSEILMAIIADVGFESFDQTENGFNAYIVEDLAQNVDLSDLNFEDFTFTYSFKKIETTNWNAEWEKNFEPVVIEPLLCIRAPFHPKNLHVKHEIVIMPKMSFGTGHHQTTRQVCAQMFKTDFKNKRVLDMGCGTGILAILATILEAKNIVAIDIDEWSVENAIENCRDNNAYNITIKKGDVESLENEAPFDIILANINKNILKSQIPVYANKIAKGGQLFLSGFFTTDVAELTSLAETVGFKYLYTSNEDEWAVLIMERV